MSAPRVLVVDDQPVNVQLLRLKLEREGLQVLAAANGREALAVAAEARPDLILLDVVMPELDGVTACRELRAAEATRDTPILFLTGSPSREHRAAARAAGAADYLVKPLDLDEAMGRIRTHLRLARLEREAAGLTRRLDEARRAATLGAAAQGVTHQLNNLLGVLVGYLELLKGPGDVSALAARHAPRAEESVQRVVQLVRQFASLAAKSRPPSVPLPVADLLAGAVARFRAEHPPEAAVRVETACPELAVTTHREALEDALSRLLANAWESYAPGADRPLLLEARAVIRPDGRAAVELRVSDQGRGVDPGVLERVFEPFVGTKGTPGSGLGLTIARHAIRALGGEITLQANPGGGTTVALVHPVAPPAAR